MKFTELNLHEDLMKSVNEVGFVDCTPVQDEVFANAFAGKDVYVQSQTGTGKTAAYMISIYQRLLTDPELKGRKAFIVVPTRELAVQVEEEAKRLGKGLPLTTGAFYGGVGYGPQENLLRDGVDIMVGTPGRMLDFQKQGKMLLKDVGFLVIDEADRMFDMGFLPDLRSMLRYLPPREERQTMLFSATLNVRVKNLAWDYMENPAEIVIEPEHVTVNEITQELYHVGSHEKVRFLLGILKRDDPESVIIFANTKRTVEELARRLRVNGIECEFIIGDLPQKQRSGIIDGMKSGKHTVLVATDVAARGLDIEDLSMVINYDIPMEAENYVHRIGRTARAGKSGKAITFACEKFVYGLPAIEKYIERKLPAGAVEESMFAEDKSAGMRIRTDRYESQDRGPRRGGSGGAERPGQRRGGAERSGQRRLEGAARGAAGRGARGAPKDQYKERVGPNQSLQAEISAVASGRVSEVKSPAVSSAAPRGPDSGTRSASKNPRGGANHGGANRGGSGPNAASRGSSDARPGASRGPDRSKQGLGGQGSGGQRQRGGPRPASDANPYAVSMEERLQKYRQKYGAQGEQQAQPGKAPASAAKGRETKAREPRGKDEQRRVETPRKAQSQKPAEPKKGIPPNLIERVIGIFGKKKK